MAMYKVVLHYSDGTIEEEEEILNLKLSQKSMAVTCVLVLMKAQRF